MKQKIAASDSVKIAAWAKEGKKNQQIADLLGVTLRTIQRHMAANPCNTKRFKAKLGVELEKQSLKQAVKEAKVIAKEITFSFADAARRYTEIADYTKNDFCKLKAIDSLVNLFGVARINAAGSGIALPEEPDVYVSEWRKPQ